MDRLIRKNELGMERFDQIKRKENEIYTKIFPNKTMFDIQFGMFIPKRFSPCGRYLISFSIDLYSILVSDVVYKSQHPRDFFDDKTIITIGKDEKRLSKETCFFTENGKYALVVSICPTNKEETRTSSTISFFELLEDIQFDLIYLKKGTVSSSFVFECDCINLTTSSGISLIGSLLCILSIKYQCAKVFDIKEGTFSLVCFIGENLFMEEPFLIFDSILIGFKQRFLSFIYKKLFNMNNKTERLRYFHHQFESFKSLIIWKIQFLNTETVMMQIGNPVTLLGSATEHSRAIIFFVKYKFKSAEIISVSTNTDTTFLECFLGLEYKKTLNRKSGDSFQKHTPSPKNCLFEKRAIMKKIEILSHHKKEGREMAIRKLALSYPLNKQTDQKSPYLHKNLFLFHDGVSGNLKQILYKNKTNFFDQKTKKLLFSLPLIKEDLLEKTNRYASYVFHPTHPLIITVFYSQTTSFYINVHYRQA